MDSRSEFQPPLCSSTDEEDVGFIHAVEKILNLHGDPAMEAWKTKGVGLFGMWSKIPEKFSALATITQDIHLEDHEKAKKLKEEWRGKAGSCLHNTSVFFGLCHPDVDRAHRRLDSLFMGDGRRSIGGGPF